MGKVRLFLAHVGLRLLHDDMGLPPLGLMSLAAYLRGRMDY